jgi:hypothetical protein
MIERWLICGTRKQGYGSLVRAVLTETLKAKRKLHENQTWQPVILEGCCPNSADEYAEEWAKELGITNEHYPSTAGNYLKRNIEMVQHCTEVIAFFDLYSYGTAHTIANAVAIGIPVRVIMLQ